MALLNLGLEIPGIVTLGTKCIYRLWGFTVACRDAPADVDAIIGELFGIKAVLTPLHQRFLADVEGSQRRSTGWIEGLQMVLAECRETYQELLALVNRLGPDSSSSGFERAWKSFRWTFRDRSAQSLRAALERFKTSFTLMLVGIDSEAVTDMKETVQNIHLIVQQIYLSQRRASLRWKLRRDGTLRRRKTEEFPGDSDTEESEHAPMVAGTSAPQIQYSPICARLRENRRRSPPAQLRLRSNSDISQPKERPSWLVATSKSQLQENATEHVSPDGLLSPPVLKPIRPCASEENMSTRYPKTDLPSLPPTKSNDRERSPPDVQVSPSFLTAPHLPLSPDGLLSPPVLKPIRPCASEESMSTRYPKTDLPSLPPTKSNDRERSSPDVQVSPSFLTTPHPPLSPMFNCGPPSPATQPPPRPEKRVITLEDSYRKVLRTAVRKYAGADPSSGEIGCDAENSWVLIVGVDDGELVLSPKDKPLLVFQTLQEAGRSPKFLLRPKEAANPSAPVHEGLHQHRNCV